MRPLVSLLSGLLFVAPFVSAQQQPDFAREARMAAEVEEIVFDGDPIWLEAKGFEFLAIEMEADEPKGTVVILHGRGYHPDWESVIQPLRVGLVDKGWNTLSIQLPVLEKSAKYFDYVDVFDAAGPRIDSALSYAQSLSDGPLVLLAHSCGSHMAQRWIKNDPEAANSIVDAYVGIGMGATDYKQPMVEPFQLDKMTMPVLDLYGTEDFPAVLRKAPERLAMLTQAGNEKSQQVTVQGAKHYFKESKDQLLESVSTWLETL